MSNSTIFIKTVKKVDHTVFCVDSNGQKSYWDSLFEKKIPYSSGQQVKRSIVTAMLDKLGIEPSPFILKWEASKQSNGTPKIEFKNGYYQKCTPIHPDQLVGGWMVLNSSKKDNAPEIKNDEPENENEDTETEENTETANQPKAKSIKRRSPLSISAMTPLHPLLANICKEGISLDKRETPNTEIVVKSGKTQLTDDEIQELLLQKPEHNFKNTYVFDNTRASGLFVQNIAIDLKRLFAISLDINEPEVQPAVIEELKTEGWTVQKDNRGEYLLAPKSYRDELIPGIAYALVNWTINSNQSRTYSPMETLALSISDNANSIATSIYAKLDSGNNDKQIAIPVIHPDTQNVDVFITPQAQGFFPNIEPNKVNPNAMNEAITKLTELFSNFEY